jgi:hypothetical protein
MLARRGHGISWDDPSLTLRAQNIALAQRDCLRFLFSFRRPHSFHWSIFQPSAESRLACRAPASRDRLARRRTRPLPTTRCHGTDGGQRRSAQTTVRTLTPASAATWPYVFTSPLGIASIDCQIFGKTPVRGGAGTAARSAFLLRFFPLFFVIGPILSANIFSKEQHRWPKNRRSALVGPRWRRRAVRRSQQRPGQLPSAPGLVLRKRLPRQHPSANR